MCLISQPSATFSQRRADKAGVKFTTFIPVRFRKRGVCTVIVPVEADAVQPEPAPLAKIPPSNDTVLLTALGRAFYWQRLLDEGRVTSGLETTWREGLHPSTVNELLRLNLLAPDIVDLLIAGRQPGTMTLRWFQEPPLPVAREKQREIVVGSG